MMDMVTDDWRTELSPDTRERIVNRIFETLNRLIPFSDQDLKAIAIRLEEKTFSAATSQSDYLRKVSLKILTFEGKSQNAVSNPTDGTEPPHSGASQPEVPDQRESLSIPLSADSAQSHQQLLSLSDQLQKQLSLQEQGDLQ